LGCGRVQIDLLPSTVTLLPQYSHGFSQHIARFPLFLHLHSSGSPSPPVIPQTKILLSALPKENRV
jgi:hypothetical protein